MLTPSRDGNSSTTDRIAGMTLASSARTWFTSFQSPYTKVGAMTTQPCSTAGAIRGAEKATAAAHPVENDQNAHRLVSIER